VKIIFRKNTESRISIILTILSILCYVHSIWYGDFTVGDYGVFGTFKPTFYAALLLLTIASLIIWKSKEKHSPLLVLHVVMFASMLWLTPYILGGLRGVSGITTPFTYYGLVDHIMRTSHVDTSVSQFLNWPGQMILTAVIFITTNISNNIDPNIVIALSAFFLQFLFFLPIYLIIKFCLKNEYPNLWAAGFWIFEVANWGPENKFSAQSIGLFYLFFLLFVFIRFLNNKDRWTLNYRIIIILMVACIVITHFVTSLVVIFSLLFLFGIRRLTSLKLVVLTVIIFLAWAMYGYSATVATGGKIGDYLQSAFNINELGNLLLHSTVIGYKGSAAAIIVNRSQLLTTAIWVVIAITGIIFNYWRKRDTGNENLIMAFAFGCVFGCFANIYTYGNEIIYRIALFVLPVIVYFCCKLLLSKYSFPVFILALLVTIPLFFLNQYASLASTYMKETQLSASQYITTYANQGHIVTLSRSLGIETNVEKYTQTNLDPKYNPEMLADSPDLWGLIISKRSFFGTYFVITREQEKFYKYTYDRADLVIKIRDLLDNSETFNFIYKNNDISIYYISN
jgi:hypothetical protein